LYSTKQKRDVSRKQLRSFGLIVATGFLVIGLWPLIFRHQSARVWALAITVIFGTAGLLVPTALRKAHQIWMKAGELLGWVNSKVILGSMYYLLLTPIRALMSVIGYDPMNRKFNQKVATYRVDRKARPVSHMTHQF